MLHLKFISIEDLKLRESQIKTLTRESANLKKEIIQLLQGFCHKYAFEQSKIPNIETEYQMLRQVLLDISKEIQNTKEKIASDQYLQEQAELRIKDLVALLPNQKSELERYLLSYTDKLLNSSGSFYNELFKKQSFINEDSFTNFVNVHVSRHAQRFNSTFVGYPDRFLPYIIKEYFKSMGILLDSSIVPNNNSKDNEPHFYVKNIRKFPNSDGAATVDSLIIVLLQQTYLAHIMQQSVLRVLNDINKNLVPPEHNLFYQQMKSEIENLFKQGSYVHVLNLNYAFLHNKKLGKNDSFKFKTEDTGTILLWPLVKIVNVVLDVAYWLHDREKPLQQLMILSSPDSLMATPYAQKALKSLQLIRHSLANGRELFLEEIEADLMIQSAKEQQEYAKQLECINNIIVKMEVWAKKSKLLESLQGTFNVLEEPCVEIVEKAEKRKAGVGKQPLPQLDDIAEKKLDLPAVDYAIFGKAEKCFNEIVADKIYQVPGYAGQPLLISFSKKLLNELNKNHEEEFLEEIMKNTKIGIVRMQGQNGINIFYYIQGKTKRAEIKFLTAKYSNKRIVGYPLMNSSKLVYHFSEIIKK